MSTGRAAGRPSLRLAAFLALGLLVALLLAGVVSNFASGSPDGLDATARDGCTFDADDTITGGDCPARRARDHDLADGPLAGYAVRGVRSSFAATGLAGVTGVLVVFGIGVGLFQLLRRRDAAADGGTPGGDGGFAADGGTADGARADACADAPTRTGDT